MSRLSGKFSGNFSGNFSGEAVSVFFFRVFYDKKYSPDYNFVEDLVRPRAFSVGSPEVQHAPEGPDGFTPIPGLVGPGSVPDSLGRATRPGFTMH